MKIQEIKMSFSQNKLNRCQHLSGASVDLSTLGDNILPGAGDEEKVADLSVDVPSKRNKELKKNPFCKPDILLTSRNTTLFTLFGMTFIIVLIEP